MKFDRDKYFNEVRHSVFGGSMTQEQVDGQNFLLSAYEKYPVSSDPRHFAYMLATTKHETASTMLPIEEYGKGKGKPYGKIDPDTGQGYWGRGHVQLTWKENYAKATRELGLTGDDDLVKNADRAMDPTISARIMFLGMRDGWFRGDSKGRQTLIRYFDADTDDPFNAREIINGDRNIVPPWSGGKSIGKIIEGYHDAFQDALEASLITGVDPNVVTITISAPSHVKVVIKQETTDASSQPSATQSNVRSEGGEIDVGHTEVGG